MIRYRRRIIVSVLTVLTLVAIFHTPPETNMSFLAKQPKRQPKSSRIVFPKTFPAKNVNLLRKSISLLSTDQYSSAKLQQGPRGKTNGPRAKFGPNSDHPINIFHAEKHINLDLDRCGELYTNMSGIIVSDKMPVDTSLKNIIRQIIESIDGEYDEYLLEMAPYFYHEIRLQYLYDVYDKHWFRMAGSSVWLEEYGVHMMVSRLAYTADGSRNNPKLSFLYAELFTPQWKPAKLSLVVPTNMDKGKRVFRYGDQNWKVVDYPSILPIPFFHEYDDYEQKYLGPEDARLTLVKNANGHEEPLLVFNAHHQKAEYVDDDEDDYLVQQMNAYRSMWISWPWQFQTGKVNTDGLANERFDTKVYNRAKELMIKNLPRQVKQKNWTPMVSQALRAQKGYDQHILFVYRWANLQILKCDLIGDERCGFVYSLNDRLVTSSQIGPLRGGTQMINVNELLEHTNNKELAEKLIPKNREVWVGFARAHLKKCGCGNDLYRPNFVVIVKDTVTDKDGNLRDIYKMSHLSGFMSLNVDIIPWNPQRPYELCAGTNALIPNGISKWDIQFKKDKFGELRVSDEVRLAISVSDSTLDAVHMKGLFQALIKTPGMNLFADLDKPFDESEKKRLRIPANTGVKKAEWGYNNDNLVCAMQDSERFCSQYGHEKIAIENEMKGGEDYFDVEIFDENMYNYKAALYELGLD